LADVDMPDVDLIQAGSLSGLYREHHSWLQNWLRSRLGNVMDAEDVAQDTFVRVIRSRQDVASLRKPRGFLVTVARGLTIGLFRRRSLEQQYLDALAHLPKPEWPSEEEQALVLETLLEFDAMLDGLGHKIRQAFIYAQFEGLTYVQIAAILGVSDRTVKNYMAKALAHCCLYRRQLAGA